MQAPDWAAVAGQIQSVEQHDSLKEAAIFLAGALDGHDFRLFRNGGLPLLERHYGAIRQEIILQPGRNKGAAWIPVTLRLHVSHRGVKEVRQRYWRPETLAPETLVSGNAGALLGEQQHIIWNLALGMPALRHMSCFIHEWILPYLEVLETPSHARVRLYGEGLPPMEPVAALEWMLCEFGRAEASQFLEAVLFSDDAVRVAVRERMRAAAERGQPIRQDSDPVRQIAIIADVYELRRRNGRLR